MRLGAVTLGGLILRTRSVLRRSKLGVWIDEHGWTRQQLADELGIALGRPSLETAFQIEDLTEGAVPVRLRGRIG